MSKSLKRNSDSLCTDHDSRLAKKIKPNNVTFEDHQSFLKNPVFTSIQQSINMFMSEKTDDSRTKLLNHDTNNLCMYLLFHKKQSSFEKHYMHFIENVFENELDLFEDEHGNAKEFEKEQKRQIIEFLGDTFDAITVGTQETPKNLSVSGVLSAKTLELTDPLDFSQGITTVGIGSFGSIEAGGLSKINELLISGIVQMDNTAIFTSLADFRSDVTIQSLQVSGDTVVNKLTSSVFDSSEIEANRLVVKGQTFVDSLTVNESAAFADSVFMSSLVNINTLNVEQQSTFSGNVAVGTQQARRNMSVSGSTSLNSLQVSGSTQFSDQVNVGTSEQQRDLVVEGNISCKNINASESVVTQGLTTVAQFLSETEPVALSNKTFFVADTFKTSIFIDSTVPQYHMFSVFNKSSSKLNIQVYFNNEFDSFSAETKINVSKFRAIRKAGDIVTQLEISPAFSSILFGISSYRTVSIMFFIQPDETDPSQNIAVFQSNDFVDGITH